MSEESRVRVVPDTADIPSSPDWASDDSGRCFCSDLHDLQDGKEGVSCPDLREADYAAMGSDLDEAPRKNKIASSSEMTKEEWDEHTEQQRLACAPLQDL